MNSSPVAPPRSTIFGFGLVAMSIMVAQIVLSRLFAAIMTYYYAFMLISLAMLGLASGSLLVQVLPRLFAPRRFAANAMVCAAAMGMSGIVGTLALLVLYVHTGVGVQGGFTPQHLWALAGLFWCLFPFFLFGGLVVALVFAQYRDYFNRLYAVDLTFAAAGCLLAIAALGGSTPVQVLFLFCVIPILAAALFGCVEHKSVAAGVVGVALMWGLAGQFLSRIEILTKPPHAAWVNRPAVLSEWNAVSAVRVHPGPFYTWGLSGRYAGPRYDMLGLIIDGLGGTGIVRFDGNPATLSTYDYLDYDVTALGNELAPPHARQLIIGPGGGVDILQAVRMGRTDITAVEINPLIARVVNDDLASFSGSPYRLPGVATVIENGRTYIKRARDYFDLISLTWVDTGGSATALAFSENYLYTVEAYREYLHHLTPNGYLAFLRALGTNEVVRVDSMRGIAVAWEALRQEGVEDPSRHLLATAVKSPFHGRPMCLVMVKKSPLTKDDVVRAQAFASRFGFEILWAPPVGAAVQPPSAFFAEYAALVQAIVTERDRAKLFREAPFDILPATDDNPFFFVERGRPGQPAGEGVMQLQTLVIALIALIVPFLLVPVLPSLRRSRQSSVPRGAGIAALAYFSLVGLAFMGVEMELFHVFAMLLGSPLTTLAIVLAGLLLSAGVGSYLSSRFVGARPSALAALFAALVLLLAAFLLGRDFLLSHVVGASLAIRVLATIAVIAPLGVLMGMPMAIGMSLIRESERLVLWGWSLNGVFSVLSTAGALYSAIYIGTARTFMLAALSYALAGIMLQLVCRVRSRSGSAAPLSV